MFQKLLHEQTIKPLLEASSREAAFAELTAVFPAWVLSSRQKSEVLERLLQQELQDPGISTHGLATPHCYFDSLAHPVSALGISKKGIFCPAARVLQPVHFVLLTIFPDSGWDSSSVLTYVQNFFSDRFMRERLRLADSAEEVYEILIRESQFVEPQLLRFRQG